MRTRRTRPALGVAVAVGTAVLLGFGGGGEPSPPTSRRHLVEIRSFRFEPAHLAAAPGDTVVWINRDLVPHTATGLDGGWDSQGLAPDDSWSHVVPAGGLGEYLCSYHPNMTGTVATR